VASNSSNDGSEFEEKLELFNSSNPLEFDIILFFKNLFSQKFCFFLFGFKIRKETQKD
jgi:hypothetical protein